MISDNNIPPETRAWAAQKTKALIREIDKYAGQAADRAYLCSVIAMGLMGEAALHLTEVQEHLSHITGDALKRDEK